MHNFYSGKSIPNFWAIYAIFYKTAQSKQSPNWRKFAQSGSPAYICVSTFAANSSHENGSIAIA
jgi:hypothetical protein